MAIIEVGCMIVKPEKNVLDGSTTEGQILNKAWNSVLVAPDGPRWNCWGVEAGDSRRLWGFFEFESIEHHAEFAKTFRGEAVKDLPLVLESGEFSKHVEVSPSALLTVLSSSITRIVLLYFPSDVSAEDKEAASASVQQVVASMINGGGIESNCHGWGVENDFKVLGAIDGSAGSVLMVFMAVKQGEGTGSVLPNSALTQSLREVSGVVEVVESKVAFRPVKMRK